MSSDLGRETGALDVAPGWPDHDPWPPDPQEPMHPLVAAARRVAKQVVEPRAAQIEDHGVTRELLDRLAAARLIGAESADAVPAVSREVTETLSGASGSAWFVAAQHRTPYRMLAASENASLRERWLAGMAEGRLLGAIALGHLRRPKPAITATPSGRGWRLDGVADWCTGWGLTDVLLVGAVAVGAPGDGGGRDTVGHAGDPGGADKAAGRHVFALLPARSEHHGGPAGLGASEPLRFAAMRGAHTSRLYFSHVELDAADIVAVQPRQDWLAADAHATASAKPAAIGVLRRALAALANLAHRRGDPPTQRAVDQLAGAAQAARTRAYRMADDATSTVAERAAVRGELLDLAVRATSSLVVARGGASMAEVDPAARWAREALFHLVQAQSYDVRAATLAAIGGTGAR